MPGVLLLGPLSEALVTVTPVSVNVSAVWKKRARQPSVWTPKVFIEKDKNYKIQTLLLLLLLFYMSINNFKCKYQNQLQEKTARNVYDPLPEITSERRMIRIQIKNNIYILQTMLRNTNVGGLSWTQTLLGSVSKQNYIYIKSIKLFQIKLLSIRKSSAQVPQTCTRSPGGFPPGTPVSTHRVCVCFCTL